MNKRVLIAFSGGQPIDYLLKVLSVVAEREQSAFGYYAPRPLSPSHCACTAFVKVGEQRACKEFLPEEADVIMALEELEGRRVVRYLAKEGRMVLCYCHRLPMAVAVGTMGYPTDIQYRLGNEGRKVWLVKRVEMKPPFVAAMLLRAMGYAREETADILAACDLVANEQDLQTVYEKEDIH